nr:hypothetical protein [Tanacetum cinerariifolium]
MLAAWQDKGYWEVSVNDYRQYMDCWHEVDKRGQGTLALLETWSTKNRSRRPITDKTGYCNAAFIRAGKRALESAKQRKGEAEVEAEMLALQAYIRNKLKAQ